MSYHEDVARELTQFRGYTKLVTKEMYFRALAQARKDVSEFPHIDRMAAKGTVPFKTAMEVARWHWRKDNGL